jgi:hypothetical protein
MSSYFLTKYNEYTVDGENLQEYSRHALKSPRSK